MTISVEVWLYGPLANYAAEANRGSHAQSRVALADGGTVQDLLNALGLPAEERGITFINGKLSAMPGLQPDLDQVLEQNDRVSFFHLKSMWPFQYRDGAAMAPGLAREMGDSRFHHRGDA